MTCDLAYLWERYKKAEDLEARDFLIEHYLPFVKNLASGVIRKLRAGVELDDLISDGVFGLIRAIELFEPERGIKFETYATPVVRGAIFNGIRALDWVPERTREKTRALQKAMDNFASNYGRVATESELAEELKISTSDVYNLIVDLGCIYLLSLEQPLSSDEEAVILDTIEDTDSSNPLHELEFKEQRQALTEAVEALSERDRQIIQLYYFEGLSFDKIAQMINVSKQRISQLHVRIMKQLREAISIHRIATLNTVEDSSVVDMRA